MPLPSYNTTTNQTAKNNTRKIRNSYLGTETSVDFFPAIIQIEPTNKCNLACLHCPNSSYKDDEIGMMDFELFKKVVDETSQSTAVYKLSFLGEPTLSPHIYKFIEYAKIKSDARVVMFTNGTTLTRNNMLKIIDSKLDELVFSIDGMDIETIKNVRIGLKPEMLLQKIKEFYFLKKGSKPDIAINYVVTEKNKHEVADAKVFWENLKIPIQFSSLVDWADQYNITQWQPSEYGNSSREKRPPCADLWYKMVIRYNGDVVLCCNDYNSSHPLGNAHNSPLSEIWNSSLIEKYRSEHRLGAGCSGICKKCNSWNTLDEMEMQISQPLSLGSIGARP